MAEATLVAPEETQVPQPEDTPPSPPAPETQEQQTPESDAEPSLEAALEEFLRPSTQAEEVSTTGTESDDEELTPAEQAKFDRLRAKEAKRIEELNRETQDYNDLRDLTGKVRGTALQSGFSQEWADWLVDRVMDGRNLGLKVGRHQARDTSASETVDLFYEEMAAALPARQRDVFLKAKRTEHTDQKATIKAWMDMAREGYVPAKEVQKARDEAKAELKAFLIEKKLLKGHDAPPASGTGIATNAADDDAKLADPNTPIEVVMAIRARQRAAGA